MFSKPKHGWTTLNVKDNKNDFKAPASYITDIPNSCLKAFTYGLEQHCSVVIDFDAEGFEYLLVSSKYDTYIIVDDENCNKQLFYFEINMEQLAKELIEDLERDYDSWIWWNTNDVSDEPCDNFSENLKKLKMLLSITERN